MRGFRNIGFDNGTLVLVDTETVRMRYDLNTGKLLVEWWTCAVRSHTLADMLVSIQTVNKRSFCHLKPGAAMLVQADVNETKNGGMLIKMAFETKKDHQPRVLFEGRAIRFQVYASSDFRRFMPRVGRILPGTRGGPNTRRRNW